MSGSGCSAKGEFLGGAGVHAIEGDLCPIFSSCMHRNATRDLWLDLEARSQLVLTIGNQHGRPGSKSCSILDRMACGTRNRHNCVEIPPLWEGCQNDRQGEYIQY